MALQLEVEVVEARDLLAADMNGKSDPYVKLYMDKQKSKTTTQKKTLSPLWRHQCKFSNIQPDSELKLVVWDHDTFSDDYLGQLILSRDFLAGLKKSQEHCDEWFGLVDKHNNRDQPRGSIHLQLRFKLG
eukprot:TRINITY_DN5975_c0_g1_i2.p1 TRINITY_DN5975_c0_g1~~TRINITY_DN5975_c0_g1_i2.p1  ORF type:complete len:130 (-),score=23.05 TRINITY_DN5975_c0_g1_i2:204-593(-)